MPFDTPSDKRADEPLYGTAREGSGVSKEIWVAVITASGTILAAVIAAAVAIGTGNASVPGLDGSPSVSSLERTISRLQQEVSALNAENEDLSGQVGDLTTQLEAAGETAAAPSGSTSAGEVVRSTEGTPIRIGFGDCLDLDSTAPNWGVPDGDFCIWAHDVQGQTMTVLDEAPDAEICAAQTNVEDYMSGVAPTLLGKHLCVKANSGRYADVQVVTIDETAETYDLNITVWK